MFPPKQQAPAPRPPIPGQAPLAPKPPMPPQAPVAPQPPQQPMPTDVAQGDPAISRALDQRLAQLTPADMDALDGIPPDAQAALAKLLPEADFLFGGGADDTDAGAPAAAAPQGAPPADEGDDEEEGGPPMPARPATKLAKY